MKRFVRLALSYSIFVLFFLVFSACSVWEKPTEINEVVAVQSMKVYDFPREQALVLNPGQYIVFGRKLPTVISSVSIFRTVNGFIVMDYQSSVFIRAEDF